MEALPVKLVVRHQDVYKRQAVSYALYNQLNQMAVQEQSQQMEQLAQKALTVAKDIHEVKKEYLSLIHI